MKGKNTNDLKKLMSISDKLADLNVERFQLFESSHHKENSKQAMYAFTGDVYQGLNATEFDQNDVEFAQKHIRILSGLYGLLRPLDTMQPYRLEMGTKLTTPRGKNLYEFWSDNIARKINADLKEIGSNTVINLASQEYYKSVASGTLKADVYNISFLEFRDGKYKIISFSAKKARGYMSQFIVKNRIEDPLDLRHFAMENYMYNQEMSDDRTFVFTR